MVCWIEGRHYSVLEVQMNPIELINKARRQLTELGPECANAPPFESIRNQLDYLLALAEGTTRDRSKLARIIIGVQAVREVEPVNQELAVSLHEIQSWADSLLLSTDPP